jgi:predicted GIY-YIG superfamily endonuclease
VTNDIIRRGVQRRTGNGSRVTRENNVHTRVRYEPFTDIREASQREKTTMEWQGARKANLTERDDAGRIDLYPSLPGVRPAGPLGVR